MLYARGAKVHSDFVPRTIDRLDSVVLLFLAKVLIQLENLHEVLQGNLILSYATQNISKETS